MTKRKAVVVAAPAAEQMFVRVPLPPELVAVVRKHVDRAGGLFELGRGVLELVMGTSDAARRLVDESLAAAADVERDVKRARKAMGGRRRRQRRRPSS